MATYEEIVIHLEKVDLDLLTKKLLKYADIQIRKKIWLRKRAGLPSGALSGEDFVNQAYEKLINRTRDWDINKCPSLEQFLRGIISSDIDNLRKKPENILTDRFYDQKDDHTDDNSESKLIATESPEDILIEKESERCVWEFYEFLDNEPDIQGLCGCIIDNIKKRAEMAKELNVSVSDITNMQKRLRRRWESFQKEGKNVS